MTFRMSDDSIACIRCGHDNCERDAKSREVSSAAALVARRPDDLRMLSALETAYNQLQHSINLCGSWARQRRTGGKLVTS